MLSSEISVIPAAFCSGAFLASPLFVIESRVESNESSDERLSSRLRSVRERTTSPLQIGHVRRRLVSHGVLIQDKKVSIESKFLLSSPSGIDLHALHMIFVTAWETHYFALTIHILLQAYCTFDLSVMIFPLP